LLLDQGFFAAFEELVLSDFAVVIGINHLKVDNERGGLVLRERVALPLGQAPNRFAFSLIENCTLDRRRGVHPLVLKHRSTGASEGRPRGEE
jgi:hypothetical protein